jgi:hypothetical protein
LLASTLPPNGLVMVASLVLGRRHVANRLEQAPRVEPIAAVERREFEGVEVAPRPCATNDLRLEESNRRFGERVEAPMCRATGAARVLDKLGEGGMRQVYRSRQCPRLHSKVGLRSRVSRSR